MNKMIAIGRLTHDVVLAQAGGKDVVRNSIAVDDGKDKDGNKKTLFLDFSAFDNTAKIIAQYAKKGDRIYLEGRLQVRDFTRDDGSKSRAVSLLVNSVELLEGKKDRNDLPF